MTPRADQYNLADLRASADIVEEYSDKITYLGFCKPGTTSLADEKWSILKIEQFGIVQPFTTTFQWAKGLCAFHLKWTDRYTHPYEYKKF